MTIRVLTILVSLAAGFVAYPAVTAQTPFRRVIAPKRFPYMGLPYSPAIVAGDTMYLAGQLGRDPATSQLVPGGIEAETRQTLINIREVLREGGMDFADVVSVTTFLVDFKEFETYNKVYRELFQKDPPARATVAVAALNQGGRIEMQMIAAKSR